MENTVKQWLKNYIEESEDGKELLEDISTYGLAGGIIPELIYYKDTHKFFDTHYESIMEIVNKYEEMTGEKVKWEGDLKNWFTWFAVEYTAWELLNE